ncbi:MAG: calcium-translocating P-type ATPase, PMCA-type [Gottschalkiaceae bacterium]|nr:MAG: calcium-translocating P-type ATPase, PMCA-type [Gottschalkiaceae bacterium]
MGEKQWYKKNLEELMNELNVQTKIGLDSEEVLKRRNEYGDNSIKTAGKKSVVLMFFNQFKDFMVIILILASLISGFLGEISDTIIILLVVLLNAILGVIQENKAEKSLEALKNLSTPNAKVIREGNILEIKSIDVVPGDVVIIEAGDFVPADGVIIESASLMIEESALTGESVPVEKNTNTLEGDNIPLGDRKNFAYTSSLVTNGRGKFIATGTGMNTEIGKIAQMIQSQEDTKTPLQVKLDELGKLLGIGAIVVCGIIFFIGFLQNRPVLDMFMTSVSLAVAAIPEGLPAIVTIVLSIGVQNMIDNNAIIRKLPAVETLGTASVICSDKTGTLTQNKMTVTKLYTYDKLIDIDQANMENPTELTAIMTGLLCNDASLDSDKGEKKAIGDPTEVALIVAAERFGLLRKQQESYYERVEELPFDSERKLMTTINTFNNGYRVFTKGALDVLIGRCNKIMIGKDEVELTEDIIEKIKGTNEELSSKALRVLALAYKDIPSIPDNLNSETLEKDLVFVGMQGMIDPPREEAKLAVQKSKEAGIRPIMITGDHKITAMAIAKELGILEEGQEAIEGIALEKLTDEELYNSIEKYSVYARVSPEHKVRIVEGWQKKGKIVAMTGDGVNDAPALKRADIGCAMGITGTDVSKEAADMVLTDDNFATIVAAVEEGRTIFDNIKKSIHFLLSCNIGEVVALFISIVLKLPIPLLPIHILWINLITDSLPALALGVDPAEKDIMKRKPRNPKKSIFSDGLGLMLAVEGTIIGILTLAAFNIGSNESLTIGRTMAFTTLSLSQLVHTFNTRSIDKSIFKIGFTTNKKLLGAILISLLLMLGIIFIPALREIFKLGFLSPLQWGIVLGLSLIILVAVELIKALTNLTKNQKELA